MCMPRPKMVAPPTPALAPTVATETAGPPELPSDDDPRRRRAGSRLANLAALRFSRPTTGVRASGAGTNIPY